ncbi:hypothetical protein P9112_010055 [Eukaryota sp. TZLM1-RC]
MNHNSISYQHVSIAEVFRLPADSLFRLYGIVDQFVTPFIVRVRALLPDVEHNVFEHYIRVALSSCKKVVVVGTYYVLFCCRNRHGSFHPTAGRIHAQLYNVIPLNPMDVPNIQYAYRLRRSVGRYVKQSD